MVMDEQHEIGSGVRFHGVRHLFREHDGVGSIDAKALRARHHRPAALQSLNGNGHGRVVLGQPRTSPEHDGDELHRRKIPSAR